MMRKFLLLMLTTLLVLQASPIGAVTLYDDFSTNYIKKSLWLDHFNGTTYLHERVREINSDDGTLVIKLGSNDQNHPSRMGASLKFPVPGDHPNELRALRADVKVVEVNNDPTDSAVVFGRIAGLFYNIKSGGAVADCFEGDVWAELLLGDQNNDGDLEAWFEVEVFNDAECGDKTTRKLDSETLATDLLKDHPYTLEILYDGDTSITFRISDGGSEVASNTFDGTDARTSLPHGPYGALQSGIHYSTGEYVDGYVHAEFDEVYVNGDSYDTFDAPPINQDRWNGREYVREVVGGTNGYGRLQTRGQNKDARSRLYLRDRYTPYMEATAQMESGSEIEGSRQGRVRIGGIFYNDTHGPGSHDGYLGDVFVNVALVVLGDGTREARWRLERFTTSGQSETDLIQEGTLLSPIQFGTDYKLSINFTGTQFIFGCDATTHTYTIGTAVNEPYDPIRLVESRLFLDDTESGMIKGQFRNVQVADPDYTNLSGDWTVSISNSEVLPESDIGCEADDDVDYNITVAQSNTEITITNDEGDLGAYGIISGSRVLTYSSELDGNGFFESWADMVMSDANNLAGERRIKTISDEINCEEVADIAISRAGNSAPTANDQEITVGQDSTDNAITLTGSDPDAQDALTFAVATNPTNGTLSGTAPNLLYTPTAGFFGSDSFSFTISDDKDGSDTGTVTISVNMTGNQVPVAADQSVSVDMNTTSDTIICAASDDDGDTLTFALGTGPTNGALSGTAPNLQYTPNADYTGVDSFTFTVDDGKGGSDTGTITITVSDPGNPSSGGGGGGGCFIQDLRF